MILVYILLIFYAASFIRHRRKLESAKWFLIYNNQVLMVRRNKYYYDTQNGSDDLDLPGGKYDPWKDIFGLPDTAIRCLHDDTRLKIGQIEILNKYRVEFKSSIGDIIYIYAMKLDHARYSQLSKTILQKVATFDPVCDSIQSFHWVNIESLPDTPTEYKELNHGKIKYKSIRDFRSLYKHMFEIENVC